MRIKEHLPTIILFALLVILSIVSIFVGVLDVNLAGLFQGDTEQLEILIISRLPRLLAILCTGIGMSVSGLIMQQLCMNKFVSPTTGATITSAQLGILIALLFMPQSTLWSRALFAFGCAIAGTWIFVWFIQRIQFKDVIMVPLIGIMFSNVIGGITSFLAYKFEMTQAKANKARLHKVDWGIKSRAIRIPSWAEVMVAPVVGDTNLFMHSCCIINPETLMPMPVHRIAKSRGRRETTKIPNWSVSP